MKIIVRDQGGGPRYTVRWVEPSGARPQRTFITEAEALEFLSTMERAMLPGGSVTRSREQIVDHIKTNTEVDENGCWLWTGNVGAEGYGKMSWSRSGQGKLIGAHRVSYVVYRDEIPTGLHIDHLCRVRRCVNPDHLEPVTCRENVMRSPITLATINSSKTHCPQGHPYDEANTYKHASSGRLCRTCMRSNARKSQVNA